jgi:hypothetical protein
LIPIACHQTRHPRARPSQKAEHSDDAKRCTGMLREMPEIPSQLVALVSGVSVRDGSGSDQDDRQQGTK